MTLPLPALAVGLLTLGACGGPPPAALSDGPPAPGGSASAAADTTMPADVRRCVPAEAGLEGGEVEFVARRPAPDDDGDLVLYEVYGRGDVTYNGEPHIYTVVVDPDGICIPLDSWRSETFSEATVAMLTDEDVVREQARVAVRRAGGAAAYAERYRAQTGTEPTACPARPVLADSHCLSGPYLDELRRLGVTVAPPPAD